MKLNISYQPTGQTKSYDIEDDKKLLPFFDKRMASIIPGDSLGEMFKGTLMKIKGGTDKQGFPMMQGVMCNNRVRLLLRKGHKCFHPDRDGYRKRKSIRGCIVGPDLSAMSLLIVRKGPEEIPGLTDEVRPLRHGPKRATKIRKMFGLTREDDVRNFVIKREHKGKIISPKIQRLITPAVLATRRRHKRLLRESAVRNRRERAAYTKRYKAYRREVRKEKDAALAVKKAAADKKAAKIKEAKDNGTYVPKVKKKKMAKRWTPPPRTI